jgi:hypothetical protein
MHGTINFGVCLSLAPLSKFLYSIFNPYHLLEISSTADLTLPDPRGKDRNNFSYYPLPNQPAAFAWLVGLN